MNCIDIYSFNFLRKRKEITYPTSMTYGDNILAMDNITQGKDYSFGAKLGKKASLKIVMSNLSVQTNTNFPKPVWFYSNQQGWTVSNYGSDDTQTFTSNKAGDVILDISFNGSPGSCKIDYYENSSSVTKTKTLNW
ncbi:MAG: hypothetical protein IPI93_01385 [Sphingobacteriaceae bacterium]|nr:hypothetical protein [Sphingobacteriaceae bacterium]